MKKTIIILFVIVSIVGILTMGCNGKGKVNGHEYVDLGLSVKWATCNVGADVPEAYGDYFAWGETKPKKKYTEYNYSYFSDTPVLPASADAATVNWGAEWRMPTEDEFEELKTKCKWTWMENGYKVEGPNGNSIFLPTAGGIRGTQFSNDGLGGYWSNSLNKYVTDYARFFDFDSDNYKMSTMARYIGFFIRPVCSK